MVLSEVDIVKADPAAASQPLLLNGDADVAQKSPGSVSCSLKVAIHVT